MGRSDAVPHQRRDGEVSGRNRDAPTGVPDKIGAGGVNAKRETRRLYLAGGWRSSSFSLMLVLRRIFEKSSKEHPHLLLGHGESLPATGGGFINTPNLTCLQMVVGMKKPFFFHAVEQGIETAGAKFVTMTGKLFDHSETKNSSVFRVIENMETNQS
jgi:hypothetical protein